METARRVLPKDKQRLLLVEDDPGVRRSLQLLFQANGYDVRAYASSATLLSDPSALDAVCLIADYRMADCDGIDTLERLRAKGWMGPAVLITGFPSTALSERAQKAGFGATLEKPLRKQALLKSVERLVHLEPGG